MLVFLEGARLAYSQAQTSGTAPSWMGWFGSPNEKIWRIPTSLLFMAVIVGFLAIAAAVRKFFTRER